MANIASTITISANAAGVGAATMIIREMGAAVVETAILTDKMKMSMEAATGSATSAGAQLEYVKEVSKKMGLDVIAATEGFTKLTAATRGTALQGEETRKIFEAFSAANTKLGGSTQDLEGMLRALQQMVSKGKVSMEELRGQLGERLPGTMRIAAESMGMMTEKLEKLISTGNMSAEEFLPHFEKAVNKTFNDGKFDTAQAAINNLNTAWLEFRQEIVDSNWVKSSANNLTSFINSIRGISDEIDKETEEINQSGKHLSEAMFDRLVSNAEKLIGALLPSGKDVREYLQSYDRMVYGEINESLSEQAKKIDELYEQYAAARAEGWEPWSKPVKKINEELQQRIDVYAEGWRRKNEIQIAIQKEGEADILALDEKLLKERLAKHEAFINATAKFESDNGKNPAAYKHRKNSTIYGEYQQGDPFFDQYFGFKNGPKTDANERMATFNYREREDATFGGNNVKLHAGYMEGVGRINQVTKEAIETGENWLIVLEKTIQKTRTKPGEAEGVMASLIGRSKHENRQLGVSDDKDIAEYERIKKGEQSAAKKRVDTERFVQTETSKLRDDGIKDEIERIQVREAEQQKEIDRRIDAYREEGLLTASIEKNLQEQKVILAQKAANDISKIEEQRAKESERLTKKQLAEEEALAKEKLRIKRSVDKFENEAAMDVAKLEGNKTRIVQLQAIAQRKILQDRYDYEIALAKGDAAQIARIEQAKSDKLRAINEQEKHDLTVVSGSYWEKLTQRVSDNTKTNGDAYQQMTTQMVDLTMSSAEDIAGAFAEMAVSGKANWEDLALGIVKQIEFIIAKLLIMYAIQLLTGSTSSAAGGQSSTAAQNAATITPNFQSGTYANGGAFDSGIEFFAGGDVVNRTTAFGMANGKTGVMGEAGPEAIMPLARGSDGKLGVRGSGGGSVSDNSITIQNLNVTLEKKENETEEEQTKRMGRAIKSSLETMMDKRLAGHKRPGGILNPTQVSAY